MAAAESRQREASTGRDKLITCYQGETFCKHSDCAANFSRGERRCTMFDPYDFARPLEIQSPSRSPLATRSPNMFPSKSVLTLYTPFKMASMPPSPPITPPSHSDSNPATIHPLNFFPPHAQSPAIQDDRTLRRPPRDLRFTGHTAVNPLVRTNEERRKHRHDVFFGRVDEQRNDRRWDLRADQVFRINFLALDASIVCGRQLC